MALVNHPHGQLGQVPPHSRCPRRCTRLRPRASQRFVGVFAALALPLVGGFLVYAQPPRAAAPAPAQLPPPRPDLRVSDEFGKIHPRLSGLPANVKPPVGTTPVPSPEQLDVLRRLAGDAFTDPISTIECVVGRPRIWTLKQAPFRVQVADPNILSYENIGNDPRQISLIGRSVGSTVLNLWFGDRDDLARQTILSYLVNVLPDPEAKTRLERIYKALEDEINRAFPDAGVCLFLVGDKLVVSGEVKDSVEATKILQIVRANAPGGQAQGQGQTQSAAQVPITQATINPNNIGPDGQVRQALENFFTQGESNIVNLLRIPGEQQVMLRVQVAEVSRAAARAIGVNFSITNNQGIQVFSQTTGNLLGNGVQQAQGTNISARLDNGQVQLAINALRNVNLARSLAEPNLVTLNGFPATFLAGGQFPVPVVTGATAVGLQGVSFVPFGVQLNFVPFISDKDRIRLQLQAIVSVRDVSTGTNFGQNQGNQGGAGGGGIGGAGNQGNQGGLFVPGLNTRSVQTVVEMREGQTLAIGGLIQTNFGASASRVPFFGDLPIIGRLFASDNTQSSESELVLLVTPELVHPMEPKEVPALPGSDLFEPGDIEFYLLGRLESLRPYDYRSQVMSTLARMCAYHRCELLYFVGPHGHSPIGPHHAHSTAGSPFAPGGPFGSFSPEPH